MTTIDANKIRFYFNNCNSVSDSFSQAGQDLFVLSALNGKKNGTYLEIGAGPAQDGSNTFLLEFWFDWTGVGVELDPGYCDNQRKHRKTFIENSDATKIDYTELFRRTNHNQNYFDYLSLDLDGENTLKALYALPLHNYKFATITYEHDYYVKRIYGNEDYENYKTKSREYLRENGYVLVLPNVSFRWHDHDDKKYIMDFEDWWVHPDLVDMDRIKFMTRKNDDLNLWNNYIFVE